MVIKVNDITDRMEQLTEGAKILKALSHPVRLCIVRNLIDNPGTIVSVMQECLDIPQSTLSQHLIKLKDKGILEGEQDGVKVHYYVINQEAIDIVKILFNKD